MRSALGLIALALGGCIGTPSPLAPGLGGTVGVPHFGVQTEARELPLRGQGFRRLRPKARTTGATRGWSRPSRPQLRPCSLPARRRCAARRRSVRQERRQGARSSLASQRPRRGSLVLRRDAGGAPVESPGFIHFGSDGLAPVGKEGDYLRLDVERQWLLVRELLSSKEAEVQ